MEIKDLIRKSLNAGSAKAVLKSLCEYYEAAHTLRMREAEHEIATAYFYVSRCIVSATRFSPLNCDESLTDILVRYESDTDYTTERTVWINIPELTLTEKRMNDVVRTVIFSSLKSLYEEIFAENDIEESVERFLAKEDGRPYHGRLEAE